MTISLYIRSRFHLRVSKAIASFCVQLPHKKVGKDPRRKWENRDDSRFLAYLSHYWPHTPSCSLSFTFSFPPTNFLLTHAIHLPLFSPPIALLTSFFLAFDLLLSAFRCSNKNKKPRVTSPSWTEEYAAEHAGQYAWEN